MRMRILFLVAVYTILATTQAFSQLLLEAESYSAMSGVQTESCSDIGRGINVGYIDDGDWLEYAINVPVSGAFYMVFRTAGEGSGKIQVQLDGVNAVLQNIAATGAWQTWQTTASTSLFTLTEGHHIIRLNANVGGFNLNWLKLFLKAENDKDNPTVPIIDSTSAGMHSGFMSWHSSTDTSSAVASYNILKEGALLQQTADTFAYLTGLPAGEIVNLAVVAIDWAGNISKQVSTTLQTDSLPWDLLWSDEFDYEGKPNSDYWFYETGGGGWGNGELQYYTEGDNAEVTGGALILEVRKESLQGNGFTSTRLNSAKANDFLYGRIEVKAKLPSTKGSWPAIWTLPTEWKYGGWPDCGEIDIMEHSILTGYGNVFGTIHTGAYNHSDGTQKSGGYTFSDVTDTYHTYAIEWYPDHIDWYYDDILVFTFNNEYKSTQEWPYDIPHHLLLNVAVGGGLGGEVDYDGEWPQKMIVDYVRVYDFKLNESDTIAPEAPAALKSNTKWSTAQFSWNAARDNYSVEKYVIYVNNSIVDTVEGMTAFITDLIPETEYVLGVMAVDYSGNVSEVAYLPITTTAIQAIQLPATIQAEDYTLMEGVDTEACTDAGGGLNVGWIDAADWMTYTVESLNDIEYKAAFRVAGEGASCSIQLLDGNGNELTNVDFTVSGGWQNWKSVVSEPFRIPLGVNDIKLKVVNGGFNLNWIKIGDDSFVGLGNKLAEEISIYPNPLMADNLLVDLPYYNVGITVIVSSIDGKILRTENRISNAGQLKITNMNWSKGLYLVSIITPDGIVTKSLEIR